MTVFRILAFLLSVALSPPAFAEVRIADLGAEAAGWLNAARSRDGASPVSVSPRLTRAAAAHAADMAGNGFFAHRGSDGRSVGDRVRRQGYGFCFVAENIARGQTTLSQVMQSWQSSNGHRRNMLNRKATEFALVRGPENTWVMVLARPGC